MSELGLCLGAVEDNLSPADHHRRAQVRVTVLVCELAVVVLREGVAGTFREICVLAHEYLGLLAVVVDEVLRIAVVDARFGLTCGGVCLVEIGEPHVAICVDRGQPLVAARHDGVGAEEVLAVVDGPMDHLGAVVELAVQAEICLEALVAGIAVEELYQRVGPVYLAPAGTAGTVGRVVHGTQRAAAHGIERCAGNAPERLLGAAGPGKVVCQAGGRLQIRRRVAAEKLVADIEALLILLHVEIYAGEHRAGCIVANEAGVAATLFAFEQLYRLLEVGLYLVVDLTHGGAFGHGAIGGSTEHHARILATQRILLGIQAAQAQVAECAHEVVLTQQLVGCVRFTLGQHLDKRVGRIDDLVAAPPEVVRVLQLRCVVVTCRIVDGRRRGAGKHCVVASHFGHVVPHLDECETVIRLAPVRHRILEHRVVAVGREHCGTRVALELRGGHRIATIEVHVAAAKRKGSDCYQDYG